MAVPDRITPIAHVPLVLRQRAEEEIDRPVLAAGLLPGAQLQGPPRDDHVAVGRDDVDVVRLDPAARRGPRSTGIAVARDRISASMLACLGARCCTRTKAMPVSAGSAPSIWVNASSPPAEAPTPTIGNAPASAVKVSAWPGGAGSASRRGGEVALGRLGVIS